MPGIGKGLYQLCKSDGRGNSDDVAAGDGNVTHGALPKMQQVAQHLPLNGGKIAMGGCRAIFCIFNCVFNLITQRWFAAEDH